jgi:phage terminase small subunit
MPNISKRSTGVRKLKALTDRQRRFVEEYVVDMNASAAAVRAGYSPKSSGLYSTMMSNQAVVAAVEDALAVKRARSEVDADRVLAELARVAFANVLDFVGPDGRVDFAALSRDAGAAVSRVSVEYFEGRDSKGRSPVLEPTPLGASAESPSPGGEGCVSALAPPGSTASSPPPQGGEGCASPEPAVKVKRVTVTLADKTAALRQISRNLGLDPSFAKASEGKPEEEDDGMVMINRLVTGVPRPGNPTGLHEWLSDRDGNYIGKLVRRTPGPLMAED